MHIMWQHAVGEIPEGHDKLLFAWERGSKLFVTDAEPVRSNRAVFWKQFLKQQATMYKTPDGFEKKVGSSWKGDVLSQISSDLKH